MEYGEKEKQHITVKKAKEILEKSGRKFTEEQVQKILDQLYLIAELVISQHFIKKK